MSAISSNTLKSAALRFARQWMSQTSLALALLAAGLLAGCATTVPLETASPHSVSAPEAMLALSPGAGAILGVVETVYVNATEQYITLDTHARSPGQNYISIQKFATAAESLTPGGLQDVELVNLDMAGEARGAVSYADMRLSPFFVQNLYGPFGYSMGRTATADLCMYAWQRIGPDRRPGGGVERGAINIRVLICDNRKSEAELLDIMFQMRIKGVTGLSARSSPVIGAVGRIITPVGISGPANVLTPVTQPTIVVTQTTVRPTQVEPDDDAVVLPSSTRPSSGTPVPQPDGASNIPSPGDGTVPIVPQPN
jgi:hypothetical protein